MFRSDKIKVFYIQGNGFHNFVKTSYIKYILTPVNKYVAFGILKDLKVNIFVHNAMRKCG